ncbi:MAG: beta family protein [Caulobacteraceae bacterium]
MSSEQHLYVPALRMKAGELQGVRDLASDIADGTLPRMIVPPAADRDESLQLQLFEGEEVPDIGGPLGAHWPERDVLIEPTHLLDEFGRDTMGLWLPKMFERARAERARPIPLVQRRDLLTTNAGAYAASVDRSTKLQFGLVLSSGDIGDHEALAETLNLLASMRLAPEQCAILVDFHDADLSNPEVVTPIIGGALEYLRLAAPWQRVVFQGTNFPDKNPAEPDSDLLVPRNEWLAWKRAVAFDPETADYLLFGDYAADCAKLVFGGGGGAAIRHYRYTTSDAWYVQRGSSNGKHEEVMRKVCQGILDSGHFAGRGFSSADNFIFLTAKGRAGPGNSTIWRAVNTTHHITRVVTDVGRVRGRTFIQRSLEPVPTQPELL